MTSTRTVKFITLKWGDKYGPEYVNRLYNNVKNTYSGPFEFWCFTDDSYGIDDNIKLGNINDFPHFGVEGNIFTIVKLDLFKHLEFEGPYVFLDLDVLLLKDLKPYFDTFNFSEPRYIENHWAPRHRELDSFQRGDCFVNSSFLVWDGNQYQWLYDLYEKNKKLVNSKFKSFDKFVYYCALDKLKFHPKDIVYTYSFGAEYPDDVEPYQYRKDYYVVLFNTSHKRGIELHDTEGWARDLWIDGRLPGDAG
jgi:hypothetical protein